MTENIPLKSQDTDNAAWDYCQIHVKLIDDGRGYTGFSGPGNKLMWFRFVARRTTPAGDYIVAQSPKTPLANMPNATLTPDSSNSGHRNVLDTLLQDLQRRGWKLQPSNYGDWWARRLRKPASKVPLRSQLRTWLTPITILILLVPLLWLFVYYARSPFRNGVSDYIELPIIHTTSQSYRVGKILPINLATRRIDPIYHQLPEGIRATSQDDLGTIVWVNCKLNARLDNMYNNCELSIIDYVQQTKTDVHRFIGTQKGPPHAIDILKYRDEAKMVDYILNLPAQ